MAKDIKIKLKVDSKTGVASVGKVSKSVKKLETQTKKSTSKMDKNFKKTNKTALALKKTFVALAGAAAIGAVISGMKNMLMETVKLGDKFHKLNIKLGLSVEMLSKLEHHADLSGVAFGAVTSSVERFQRRLALAERGIGAGAVGFKNLGVNIEEMLKLSPDEQFLKIAERIDKIVDPTKRAAAAFEIFGMTGAELTKMLPDIRKHLKGMKPSLTQEDANLMAEFTDQMAKFKHIITTIKVKVFSGTLKDVVEKIQEWTEANKELIAIKVDNFVNNTITAVKALVVTIDTLLLLLKPAAFMAVGYAVGTIAVAFGILGVAIRKAAGQNLLFVKSGTAVNNILAIMKTRMAAFSLATKAAFVGLGLYIGWEIGQALNKVEGVRKGAEHVFNLMFSIAQMAFVKIKIAFLQLIDFMRKKWIGLKSWFDSMKNAKNLKDMLQHPDKYKPGDFGFEADPKIAELIEQLEALATQFQDTKDLISRGNGLLNDVKPNPFATTTTPGDTGGTTDTGEEPFDYQKFADQYYEKVKASYERRKQLTMNYYEFKDNMFQKSLAIQDALHQEALNKEKERMEEQQERMEEIAKQISSGMTDALFEWIDGTKSAKEAFKDFAASFLREIAKMIMQQTILNALKEGSRSSGWISSVLGVVVGVAGGVGAGASAGPAHVGAGGTTAFGMANGGVLPGGFQSFASGGTVNKPTLGLIGEGRHNEAIVPLPDGRSIPVDFRGGGEKQQPTTLNVTYDIKAVDAKSFMELTRRNPEAIVAPWIEQIQMGNKGLHGAVKIAGGK